MARRVLRYAQKRSDDAFGDEDEGDDLALAKGQARAVEAGRAAPRNSDGDDGGQLSTESEPQYCAAIDGFSLYANSTVRAGDDDGLRRLVR